MSSKQEPQAKPREIVFEAGYERMKEIGAASTRATSRSPRCATSTPRARDSAAR